MTFPDSDSLDTYGGEKTNYIAVTDPTTDRDADDVNKALCSIAMMSRIAPRAIVNFTTDPTTPVVNWHDAGWGSSVSVVPTVTPAGVGFFLVEWPVSVDDELAVSHTLNFRCGGILEFNHATMFAVRAVRTAANAVRVEVYDMAGVASATAGIIITAAAY